MKEERTVVVFLSSTWAGEPQAEAGWGLLPGRAGPHLRLAGVPKWGPSEPWKGNPACSSEDGDRPLCSHCPFFLHSATSFFSPLRPVLRWGVARPGVGNKTQSRSSLRTQLSALWGWFGDGPRPKSVGSEGTSGLFYKKGERLPAVSCWACAWKVMQPL